MIALFGEWFNPHHIMRVYPEADGVGWWRVRLHLVDGSTLACGRWDGKWMDTATAVRVANETAAAIAAATAPPQPEPVHPADINLGGLAQEVARRLALIDPGRAADVPEDTQPADEQ